MGFDIRRLKDPEYFAEHKMAAHSDHVWYRDMEEAAGRYASVPDVYGHKSSFRLFLDGSFYFHYAKNPAQAIEGFEKTDYDCRTWDVITVPAHIQMEGYDIPQYVNVQWPWDGRENIWTDDIPTEFNPTADYVKYFTLPERFLKEKLLISFQGVESAFALWLNGAYVGYSQNTFSPADFDLTPYLCEGENKLAIRVFKWTIGSWCEDQDFFRFSGIFRSVFLYTVPKLHIEDLRVQPKVAENLERAALEIGLSVMAEGKGAGAVTDGQRAAGTAADGRRQDSGCSSMAQEIGNIRIRLRDVGRTDKKGDGNLIDPPIVLETIEPLSVQSTFCYEIARPKLWSAERPYLYELQMEVLDEAGNVMEAVVQRIGFRRFELKDGLMLLNGKRIVFKGVNRHEFSSERGRIVSFEETLTDIVTMKQNNINAIRTSHYPNTMGIYELCDQYGLYMVAENNLESHGSWFYPNIERETVVPGDNEKWEERMLDRVNSCYQRDKNHPSILIWSIGNESFGGKVPFAMSEKFRALDSERLVHYEGIFNDRRYNDTSDMESQMYTPAAQIAEFLKEHQDKPFLCCEYAHAMGNSCGAMHKYTDLTDTELRYQGGFIWDYIDQSLTKKDRFGQEFQAYGGDFTERPTDGNFSGNGICYAKDRKPSPKMQEVKFNYQNITALIGETDFTVVNKNLFTDTAEYDCYLILQKDGVPLQKKKIETAVAPLAEEAFPLPEDWVGAIRKAAGEYAVTVSFVLKSDMLWAAAGHEIAFGQKVYPAGKKDWQQQIDRKPLCAVRGKWNLGVKGEDFDVLFSYGGGLISYRYRGRELLEKMPQPNFWRAPTDNDAGCRFPARRAQWKLASLYFSSSSVSSEGQPPRIEVSEQTVSVAYTYYLPTAPETFCAVSYTVYGDGTVKTTLKYDPEPSLKDMPEFGMMFQLNADYDRLEWYGLGPEETYADRQKGAKLGIYRNHVADNLAGYLKPQECGSKLGVRYAKVTDAKGRGLLFEGDGMSFSALPYTPHEMEYAAHRFELPQAHHTIVRVALAQLGVGGDDSWGSNVHPEYHIDITKPLEFTFWFKGI